MALMGGGGGAQTTSITRPQYIQDMINNLSSQIKNTPDAQWVNQNYTGLNSDQEAALNQLMSSTDLRNYANQLMGAGQSGIDQLNSLQRQIQDAYGKQITSTDINNMANQLYNTKEVEGAINASNRQTEQQLATATNPAVAQQTLQQAGYGSAARLGKDNAARAALAQEQQNASDITNQAYNSAVEQAQGILSGNRQNQLSALSGLSQNATYQAGLLNSGAQAANLANSNALTASQQRWQDAQNQLDNAYNNQMGQQNMLTQNIQNKLGAASVFNGALGQNTTISQSGGGTGILGGAMSGAAAGSAFGPWGALAGAVIGGAASA